ncbi:MAG TPA: Rne/Rng family ribonuclease [Candidatus Acidoferrales bacterium]|nr:Rne/Rng family ribonuclease [Candidatus Acidoferrales bacterium]
MAKEMVISANPHETRVAILEDGQLCEIYVEREKEFALVGSIYKGRVTRVLPGMQSAFVDIGLDSDAFLYVSDFLQDIEEYDSVVQTVEEKIQKMEDQGGQVFAQGAPGASPSAAMEPVDVTPLPGETIGPISGEALRAGPPRREGFSERPHREGRPGDKRGGSGRGGRDRGRGGRHGRPDGRGRGRYGRELPQSKYASHRPYEPSEGGPAAPFESVLLPGESLSAVREHPAAEAQISAPAVETPQFAQETVPAPEAGNVAGIGRVQEPVEPLEQQESAQPRDPMEFRHHDRRSQERSVSRDRRFVRGRGERTHEPRFSNWATSLEPLPGESLSKATTHETAAEAAPAEAATVSEFHEPAPENGLHTDQIHVEEALVQEQAIAEVTESPAAHADEHAEAHPAAELTEEEATALAEQVAEAQQEEAEREAEEARAVEASEQEENGASEAESEADEAAGEAHEAEELAAAGNLDEEAAARELHAEESDADAEAAAEEIAAASEEAMPQEAAAAMPSSNEMPTEARVRGDYRARMQRPVRRGGRDRDRGRGGRRPFRGRGGPHRGQPRRTQLISELLKAGEEILVQIAKEPLGKKGARITSHVALPGRFLVYMPTLDHTGVSRKIASAEERSRLRHLVTEAKGAAGGGFIVRTAAASAAPDEVRADVEFLTKTWSEIKGRGEQRKAPTLLHRDLNLVERILRDYLSSDYTAIWVDSEEEYTKVLEFVSRFQPALANRVKLYTKDAPVYEEFGIQQEIDKGLRPKVWLKSGGYIVINHTEALVAIDVNTGKFVGRGSNRLEDTIVKTNIEAVKEIVRQIRLRDLGGIIILDLIDMEERRNRDKVMAALEEALRSDRAPSKVLPFNEFGLVSITRKRTKQALERTLCQPCPYCTGSGMVKSIPTLCYEIQSEARKMAPEIDSASLTLRVHPEIAKALKTRESGLMDELEQVSKKSIIIQADPTLHWEQYDIY